MRSMSRNLIEKPICSVFSTRYYAYTEGTKKFSFSFVERTIRKMIHGGALDETFNQNFYRWPRYDNFMQAFLEEIVSDLGLITSAAAFIRQRMTNSVEEGLKQ